MLFRSLSPLHLVVLVGFYLIPLFAAYFYGVSFCLTLCLRSPFHRLHVHHFCASCVCPLLGEVVPGVCAGFLLRGTDACPLVGGAGSSSSDGHSCVKGCVLRWL